MSAQPESPAVAVARAHVEAWSNHDFDTARSMLANDVKVTAISTNPALPQTDLTGAGHYMEGLIAYAQPVVPGSLDIVASTGDERNALLTLTVKMAGGPFGAGATAPCARLYLLDENNKIKTEQVIFYVA
jgi:SnoaL-like domain